MALKLLFDLPRGAVPDDGRLVDAAAEEQLALPVPLEREDGPLVRAQHVLQLPCAGIHTCNVGSQPVQHGYKHKESSIKLRDTHAVRAGGIQPVHMYMPTSFSRSESQLDWMWPGTRHPMLPTAAGPDAGDAVVGPRRQQAAVAVPVQRRDILALLVLVRLVRQRRRQRRTPTPAQIPYARRRVAGPSWAAAKSMKLLNTAAANSSNA